MSLYPLLRPLAFTLDPEKAHHLALWALQNHLLPGARLKRYPRLETTVAGLTFHTPVGLAAGFDKNAEAVKALLNQGFGFVETGTVTPRPQEGNPLPRLFRLERDDAIINRMGFNNDGVEAFAARLAALRGQALPGLVGSNIGKNKESPNDAGDYLHCLNKIYALSDYITVNISSPNTPDLRAMQEGAALTELLHALSERRQALVTEHGKTVPLFLKIAPDITHSALEFIASSAIQHRFDALIIGNTTVEREGLKDKRQQERGGLSGRPLFAPSTALLKACYPLARDKLALIGAGGIFSAEDAYAKVRAGASLVQLYTGLIYKGFGLARDVTEGLDRLLAQDGFTHLSEAVGVDAK